MKKGGNLVERWSGWEMLRQISLINIISINRMNSSMKQGKAKPVT